MSVEDCEETTKDASKWDTSTPPPKKKTKTTLRSSSLSKFINHILLCVLYVHVCVYVHYVCTNILYAFIIPTSYSGLEGKIHVDGGCC